MLLELSYSLAIFYDPIVKQPQSSTVMSTTTPTSLDLLVNNLLLNMIN